MAIDILKAEQVKCLTYKSKEEIEENKSNYDVEQIPTDKQN